MLIHLDTDFAGDTDDAAALAMLLGWPDAEVVGITTVADPNGARAGYAERLLALAGRDDVPVATGAGSSLAGNDMGGLPDHDAYWGGDAVTPKPPSAGEATALVAASIERGATVVAIGPYTNLALLERERPGTLRATRVVVMGGWVQPSGAGLPAWGPEMDWNVQCDTEAARLVFDATDDLTLVTLTATLAAHLRTAHLDRLEQSGPIGRLLARQGRAHAAEHGMVAIGRAHTGLPDDLLNFQYDPVAGAVALGWPGATTVSMPLLPQLDDGVLRFAPTDDGKPTTVVVGVDGEAFAEAWLAAIARADLVAPA